VAKYLLEVLAGHHDRDKCPVEVDIKVPKELLEKKFSISLTEEESGKSVPAQYEIIEGTVHLAWIVNGLKAGASKKYILNISNGKEEKEEGFKLDEKDGEIAILYNGELFSNYKYSKELSKPYMYPLIGPTGLSVTEDGPKDHVHHRSFWVAHGDVNGADIWSEVKGHGKILHKDFKKKVQGPVYAEIIANNVWVTSEGKELLDERRRVRVWALGGKEWFIDLEVVFKASYGDVVFGDTKEGGIASIRVAPSITVRAGGRIENSFGGINEPESWGKRAHWCDYSGPLGEGWVGIAIFDHQLNPRHPTYWHVRNYGLMTANIFGISYFERGRGKVGTLTLKAGDSMRFFYRLYIHKGNAREANVKDKYIDFIYPPAVNVSSLS